MEKWALWLLLEASTIMVAVSLWIIWRVVQLRKKSEQHSAADTATPSSNEPELESSPYKALAQKLELQAYAAADELKELRSSDDLDMVTRYKLWGTLVKAERAIILNNSDNAPKPILNRFMGNIIKTLESLQNRKFDRNTLTQSLKETDNEFIQVSNLLISKEDVLRNQKELHEELHKSIEHAETKLKKLKLKNTELKRLKSDLEKQKKQVAKLEQHTAHDKQYSNNSSNSTPKDKHHSTRHLFQLERLSKRQQAIIEQLQEKIKDSKEKQDDNQEEAQHMALQRMERLSIESSSLIEQLQTELENTNLSISTLQQDISEKEIQLQKIDAQLTQDDGSAYAEFKNINSNKRETLESLLGGLANFKENNSEDNSFNEQEQEVLKLEQMLKESETCVTLLAQELEHAEEVNADLRTQEERNKKEARQESNNKHLSKELAELKALRDANRKLVAEVQEMRETALNQVSDTSEKQLRNEYNRKNLELDRLQLAYSDLEKKYLGTLRQQ